MEMSWEMLMFSILFLTNSSWLWAKLKTFRLQKIRMKWIGIGELIASVAVLVAMLLLNRMDAMFFFLAGVLFRKGWLRRSREALAVFGSFSAVVIYGGIMNPAAALMYNTQSINREIILAYYVSGLPMDLVHAAATVIFIFLAAEPMLEKLDRIKVKYGLMEARKGERVYAVDEASCQHTATG